MFSPVSSPSSRSIFRDQDLFYLGFFCLFVCVFFYVAYMGAGRKEKKKMLYAFENFQKLIKHRGLILLNEAQQEQGGDSKHLLWEQLYSWACVCSTLPPPSWPRLTKAQCVARPAGVIESALRFAPQWLCLSDETGSSWLLKVPECKI